MRNLIFSIIFLAASVTVTAQNSTETARNSAETVVFSKCECEKAFTYSSLTASNIDVIKAKKTGLETVFVWKEKKVLMNGDRLDIKYITEDAEGVHVYFLDFHFVLSYVSDGENTILVGHTVKE